MANLSRSQWNSPFLRAMRTSADRRTDVGSRSSVTTPAGLFLGMLWLASACGSTPLPPANHTHFRAIQTHEARLDDAMHRVANAPCGDACAAVGETAHEAGRICAIADSVSDTDARLRCNAARERSARVHGRAECACE